MKDKQFAGRNASMVPQRPQRYSRFPGNEAPHHAGADAVAIPLAFWWPSSSNSIASIQSSAPRRIFRRCRLRDLVIFSMLGLYRAVIRFMGPRAMLTVITRRDFLSGDTHRL